MHLHKCITTVKKYQNGDITKEKQVYVYYGDDIRTLMMCTQKRCGIHTCKVVVDALCDVNISKRLANKMHSRVHSIKYFGTEFMDARVHIHTGDACLLYGLGRLDSMSTLLSVHMHIGKIVTCRGQKMFRCDAIYSDIYGTHMHILCISVLRKPGTNVDTYNIDGCFIVDLRSILQPVTDTSGVSFPLYKHTCGVYDVTDDCQCLFMRLFVRLYEDMIAYTNVHRGGGLQGGIDYEKRYNDLFEIACKTLYAIV